MTLFCVPWTMNTDDWWTHAPSWDLAEEKIMFTCFRKTNQSVLWSKIYLNQLHNDCSNAYTRSKGSSGLGSNIENVALSLQNALQRKAPLAMKFRLPKSGWHYNAAKYDHSAAACPTKDLASYFLPIANCDQDKELVGAVSIASSRKACRTLRDTTTEVAAKARLQYCQAHSNESNNALHCGSIDAKWCCTAWFRTANIFYDFEVRPTLTDPFGYHLIADGWCQCHWWTTEIPEHKVFLNAPPLHDTSAEASNHVPPIIPTISFAPMFDLHSISIRFVNGRATE